ncbi:MAG TPA: sugar transferase [Gemmataceae bacterium]|jgi:lipopolysaccharide/colanic/teichoic acid biosynthesis glycosyltransferase|nr:sugar transferase [Gemmataceae bacterium]
MFVNQEARSRYSFTEFQRPALRFTYNLWLPRLTWYEPIKIAMDLVGSSLLLILTAPLILAGALLVKLTSRGPAFYTQTRLGRHGKLFTIYKLRTMSHNCEKTSGVQWSTKGDTRVTAAGRFLRASKIDELPQLWNVVLGDMSLIGPRPERPEFLPQLEESLPFYRCRLMVRPGLTGLAQVQLPPDTDLSSVRRKLAHDLHYVRNHAFWMDLQVLAATLGYIAKLPVSLTRTALQLPGGAMLEHDYEFQVIYQSSPQATPVRNYIPTKSSPEFRLQAVAAS